MPSGGQVANLTLATSESWKDKQTGANQDRTEWHRLVVFNRQAEIAGEYLKKGAQIYVEGSLRTRKWQDKNDQERYTTEIVVSNFQMLDRRDGGQSSYNNDYSAPKQQATQATAAPAAVNINEDDIPF